MSLGGCTLRITRFDRFSEDDILADSKAIAPQMWGRGKTVILVHEPDESVEPNEDDLSLLSLDELYGVLKLIAE